MVKFIAGDEKRTLIGFGLSAGNVDKLKKDQPIVVHLEEMGLPWRATIVIFFGKDEATMKDSLAQFIGPQTIVHRESKPE